MQQHLALITLVVQNYDEAITFFVNSLGFELIEDTALPAGEQRWVVVAPKGSAGGRLLLAEADNAAQAERVGNQTGGRVFLILHTDNFLRDYTIYKDRGVNFVEPPRNEPYGTVAVFEDVCGNLWDLLEPI